MGIIRLAVNQSSELGTENVRITIMNDLTKAPFSPKGNHNKISAFTLIELLVVIAIIAILAAILFPVFARARENARRSSCQSNLKQIALGIKQYTQDYDEQFPNQVATFTVTATTPSPVGWADTIQPYIKSLQVYQCPSDDTPPNLTNLAFRYTDYFINAALGNTGTATAPIYNNGGINEAAVESPTLTILSADTLTTNSTGTTANPHTTPHRASAPTEML